MLPYKTTPPPPPPAYYITLLKSTKSKASMSKKTTFTIIASHSRAIKNSWISPTKFDYCEIEVPGQIRVILNNDPEHNDLTRYAQD